ncbi:MAG: tRNA (guanosine(37)-N1)-methyltransferase TrmD [Spirochaetota bacterium]
MTLYILTLFPEILTAYFQSSIMARAIEKRLIECHLVNIRDFAADKHKTCDDAPYGGGAGMVLKPKPLATAIESVKAGGSIRTVYPSPSGRLFSQKYARELAREKALLIICGRYEGIDQRIIDLYVDDEISIGDYVVSSGEVSALVIIDTVYRLLEGIISNDSLKEESFEQGLLEYPQYTRPDTFKEKRVPEVLLSGNHAKITAWRLQKSLEKTLENRPELLKEYVWSEKVKEIQKNMNT